MTNNLKPPRLAEWILRLLASRKNKPDILGDVEEEYRLRRHHKGRIKADLWYVCQIIFPIPFFFRTSIVWSLAVLKNYTLVAARIMRRHKAFTLINTIGLSLGMACFILTVVWAQYEFSFDRHHENFDNIYRVTSTVQNMDGHRSSAVAPLPLGPHLKANYPEVVEYSRYRHDNFYWRLQIGEAVEYNTKQVAYAGPGFFRIFDFPFVEGNPDTALNDISSVVITEEIASQYFRRQDPIGQVIFFMDAKVPMYVTGVVENIPENSHIQFDFLVHTRALELWFPGEDTKMMWEDWESVTQSLYVQLDERASSSEFESRIASLVEDYIPDTTLSLSLQPLKHVHLISSARLADYDSWGRGDIATVYLFLFISFLVLFIACINFMSLSTARSLKRSREVGIRKVNGAFRSDIIKQFMGESLLHAFTALIMALALAHSFLPLLRELTGRVLDLNLLGIWPLTLSILGITFLTGLISGIYPALFASACRPVHALKDMAETRKYSFMFLRRILVSIQFICASVMIIISFAIFLQLKYIKNKDLGYDHQNVAVFSVGSVRKNLDAFKAELLKNPNISHVAAGAAPTWGVGGHKFGEGEQSRITWEGKPDDEIVLMDMHFADYGFLDTFKMELREGRWFSREFASDNQNYVLNEAALRAMGLEYPIGKWFTFGQRKGQIIGVVKDFHTGTLRNKIAPTFFMCVPNLHVIVRMNSQDTQKTIAFIEKTWKLFVPERPIDFQWLDEKLGSFYADDQKLAKIVANYTGLSLFISCLGLLGLVSFLAENKTKEIGVRKILGAPTGSVIGLMSKEYVLIVAVSSLIACPIGYWIVTQWLANFAYNTGVEMWIFPAACLAVFLVAMLSVAYKTIKAARMNPIDSLRYE